ncbi:MAG: hypothetical protein ACLR23_27545 [Clostridia bacterium]
MTRGKTAAKNVSVKAERRKGNAKERESEEANRVARERRPLKMPGVKAKDEREM